MGRWQGIWRTTYGTMTLIQKGVTVSGRYTGGCFAPGKLAGTAAGDQLAGSWLQHDTRGRFVWTLSPSGTSWTGLYSQVDGPLAAPEWIGIRPPAGAAPAANCPTGLRPPFGPIRARISVTGGALPPKLYLADMRPDRRHDPDSPPVCAPTSNIIRRRWSTRPRHEDGAAESGLRSPRSRLP